MFDILSDRLDKVFISLRGLGRLSDADIDATAREIRVALLEADVALPVVKAFIGNVKERARGAEVSQVLNPAQQVIKIVNDSGRTAPETTVWMVKPVRLVNSMSRSYSSGLRVNQEVE